MAESTLTASDLDNLVLNEYPYPIAVNYKRLLDEQDWEKKTRICIQVFEFGLRAITLGLISQYLRDADKVSDPKLNQLLLTKLSRVSLGTWKGIFFRALQAYQGKRNLFFMPELYDFYWDTSTFPHGPRKGIRAPFEQLVQTRNDLAHGLPPRGEAGWRALFEQSVCLLRQVLGQFTFLENYDLIRIRWVEGNEYWYDIYTGLQVTSPSHPLKPKEELTEGWLYLSKHEKKFLELHPLLIFCEKELAQAERERIGDAALFDSFRRTSLNYLATVLGKKLNLTDRTLIAEFTHTVYYNIEKVKMARKRAAKRREEELSWTGLRRAVGELTAEQIETVREKYQRELYLQRDETLQKFQDFLASDKGCFVLTGKSGVGKSNFVLSLMDEYAGRKDACLLVYNGAWMSVSGTMLETISQDLGKYLALEGETPKDLFAELDKRGEMVGKTLIVVFDAINENVNGKALLHKIDQMVGKEQYRWLKVMITSRPQAWRTALKRGLRLAEGRYYRERDSDEYWVELEGFTYAEEIRMEPFDWEELPRVYAKYQEVHGLQTAYEGLTPRLRGVLRDPLMLRLVARIYEGRAIPERVRISDIYERYKRALVATGRLAEGDLIFLERELMPLMIGEGRYANKLTATQIHAAETRDGRPLWELIHSDDVLSIGQQVNAGYVRLADAEILMEQGPPTDYEIAFKYERFYDHYGGKRLFEVLPDGEARAGAYLKLIKEDIASKPYFWGVVRNALRIELERDDRGVAKEVAQRGGFLAQDVFLAALVEHGQDNHREACTLLEELYGPPEKGLKGWFRKQLKGNRREGSEQLKKVAVRGAFQLNYTPLLRRASLSSSAAVRAVALQNVYYLWERQWREGREENDGLNLLVGLSAEVRGPLGLPRPRVLEACAGISLQIVMDLVLFAESKDHQGGLATLARMWKGIFEDVLTTGEQYSGLRQSAAGILRRIVLRLGTRVALRVMSIVERSAVSEFAVNELRGYLASPRTGRRKRTIRKVAPYLLYEHGSLDEIRDELLTLARERDFVSNVVLLAILMTHVFHETGETLPFLREVFEHAFSMSPPTPAVPQTILALGVIFLEKPAEVTPELLQLFTDYNSRFHKRDRSRCRATNRWYRHSHINWYVLFYPPFHQSHDTPQSDDADLVGTYLELAAAEKDLASVDHFGRRMVSLAVELRKHGQAQRRAMWALCRAIQETPSELHGPILDAIGRIFVYFPDDVLDILDQADLQELENSIRLRATPETLGDIIGGRASWFARYMILLHPDRSRLQRLIRFIIQTTEVNSLGAWLELAVAELVDFIST